MAFRMKWWPILAVSACGLMAASKLPPSELRTTSRPERSDPPETVRFRELVSEVSEARTAVRRLHWSDSLSAWLGANAPEGWAVGIQGADTLSGPAVDGVLDRVASAVGAIPDRDPAVLLGVFVMSTEADDGPPQGAPDARLNLPPQVFFGVRDGRPYCFAVDPVPSEPRALALQQSFARTGTGDLEHNYLGLCRWIAELGVPGERVGAWLEGGAHLFGEAPSPLRSRDRASRAYGFDGRRGPFGITWSLDGTSGCRAGLAEACMAVFVDPFAVVFNRVSRPFQDSAGGARNAVPGLERESWFTWRPSYLAGGTWGTVFADLREEFGHERMKAFWTSGEEPSVAFAEAFGVEPTEWLAARARRAPDYVPPGPLPRPRTLAWVLAVLGAGAGLAVGLGRRTAAA